MLEKSKHLKQQQRCCIYCTFLWVFLSMTKHFLFFPLFWGGADSSKCTFTELVIKRNWTESLKTDLQTYGLTPAHPPPRIIQRAETRGRQDVSNRVVGASFEWFAPQTLEQTHGFGSGHWCHISGNKVRLTGGLTDTFFKHSSQLLLVRAHGPEHNTSVRLQVKDTKQDIKQ